MRGIGIGVLLIAVSPSATAHPGTSERLRQLHDQVHADPSDPQVRVRYADEAIRAEAWTTARAQARALARLAPRSAQVHRIRAEVLLGQGNTRDAERAFDTYLATKPEGTRAANAYAARARIRRARGDLAPARHDFDAAILAAPTPDLVLERGRLDVERDALPDASAGYRQGLKALGETTTVRLALVELEQRRGQYREALAALNPLLARRPGHPDWLLLRAELLDALQQPVAGIVHRIAALYLAHRELERRPTALRRLSVARAEFAAGRTAHGHAQLQQVLQHTPDLPAALALRARHPLPQDTP